MNNGLLDLITLLRALSQPFDSRCAQRGLRPSDRNDSVRVGDRASIMSRRNHSISP